MILDLGCGAYKHEGSIGIDTQPFNVVDIVRDLRRGLPFSDSTCDGVIAKHVLEHFDGEDLIFLVEEIWRVLKPSRGASVEVPDACSPNRYRDPMHKTRDWSADSFMLWEVDHTGKWWIDVGPSYRRQAKFQVQSTLTDSTSNRFYILKAIK